MPDLQEEESEGQANLRMVTKLLSTDTSFSVMRNHQLVPIVLSAR